jgi:hypothetical protein
MTTSAIHDGPQRGAAHASRSTKRVLLLVFGGLAAVLGLALLAGGGAAAVALGERDDAGYFTSGTHRLSTPARALVSENLDVDADVPGWALGDRFATARVQASSTQPVFIGIGPSAAVDRYLAGSRHAQITDVDTDPFRVSARLEGGRRRPAAPASQGFWRVQASGSGTQTITWPLEAGDWSAVAMNADGSPGVALDARFGARVPWLRWVAIGLLATGGIALVIGIGLLSLGLRRPPAEVAR